MQRQQPAPNPDAYVGALTGGRGECVRELRTAVRKAAALDEVIKWGHLVYFSGGPVLLIRAEEARVLFAFWRGKRLIDLEPRLKASGKHELATLELREGMKVAPSVVRRLVQQAVELNQSLGDPTAAAKKTEKKPVRKSPASKKTAGKSSSSASVTKGTGARKPASAKRAAKKRPSE